MCALVAAVVISLGAPIIGTAADSATLRRLSAFARLYGYVRFFHPSDEAAGIDWEAFAVSGASATLRAEESEDPRQILEELFGHIAPTVEIRRSKGAPPWSFSPPPDGPAFKVVAWQHKGVNLGSSGARYRSLRVNRPLP